MYAIEFVDELPDGHDFLLFVVPDGNLVFLRESAVRPSTLEDCWAAYRALIVSDDGGDDGGGLPDLALISTG